MQSGLLLPRQPLQCLNPNSVRHRAAVSCSAAEGKEPFYSNIAKRCLSAGLVASVSLSTLFGVSSTNGLGIGRAHAAVELSGIATVEQKYEQQISHRHPRSHLPSSDEAAALQLLVDRDLFTADAWQGMVK